MDKYLKKLDHDQVNWDASALLSRCASMMENPMLGEDQMAAQCVQLGSYEGN